MPADTAASPVGVETPAAPRVDLGVSIGDLRLTSPVMPASGCFGPELAGLVDLGGLGAVVTKTVFSAVRRGNASHRITDGSGAMLNAVGIPSPGAAAFRREILPAYRRLGPPVIVSLGGLAVADYWTLVEELAGEDVAAFEINVSCPNLEHGGLQLGTDPALVGRTVRGVVARTTRPVVVKLTPAVTDLAAVARAAEAAGATAVTVANSYPGLAIDAAARRPRLGRGSGGVSGPAIKPLSLHLVRVARQAVGIPVIGCGGISSTLDVAEYLLAGATAVQIGTATFARPDTMTRIVADLPAELARLGATSVRDLIGALDPGTPGKDPR